MASFKLYGPPALSSIAAPFPRVRTTLMTMMLIAGKYAFKVQLANEALLLRALFVQPSPRALSFPFLVRVSPPERSLVRALVRAICAAKKRLVGKVVRAAIALWFSWSAANGSSAPDIGWRAHYSSQLPAHSE